MSAFKLRSGRVTSSGISALVKMGSVKMNDQELKQWKIDNPGSKARNKPGGFAAPGLTYIQEKRIERRMGRSLDTDVYSKAIAWGEFMEFWMFKQLGLDYQMIHKDTILHPTLGEYWAGTPDLKSPDTTGESKCYQPKKFALFTDALISDLPEPEKIQNLKENFSEEYWQVVSNSILLNTKFAELISFMPTTSMMKEIREEINNYEGEDLWRYRFIVESKDEDLAVLPDDGYYNPINKYKFEVPQEDKDFLTHRVEESIKLLKSE